MASVMWSVMGLDMGLEYHRESDVAGIAGLTHSPIDNKAGNARAAKKYMIPDLGRGKRNARDK